MSFVSAYDPHTAQPWEDEPFDASSQCADCLRENVDPFDLSKVTRAYRCRDGQTVFDQFTVCDSCVSNCPGCGENITAETDKQYGMGVRYREYADDGKLSCEHHAWCAASWLVYIMAGSPRSFMLFDIDDYSKDEIAAFVAGTAKAVTA